jgi:hypothetical protein
MYFYSIVRKMKRRGLVVIGWGSYFYPVHNKHPKFRKGKGPV